MPGPAATISHMHTCPMTSGSTPHVGGPIIGPGEPTVLIGGKPASVMGDQCTCTGPPDVIVEGVSTVLIGGKPATTLGSKTAHGGVVTIGEPTVIIGTSNATPTAIMAVNKIPFPKITLKDRVLASVTGNSLAEAQALQDQLKEVAESTEGVPRVYNIRWMKEDTIIRESRVLKQVIIKASVQNIADGESVSFNIRKPIETINDSGESVVNKEDVITLTGTVLDKEVEVTWEVEEPNEGNTTEN